MKIFLTESPYGQKDNNTPAGALYNKELFSLRLLPDTAVLGTKCPFFVPDFAAQCRATLCAALRVSRLGRSIHPRFAARYYDKVTAALHFTAHPLLERLLAEGIPADRACGFDGALALGRWEADAPETMAVGTELAVRLGGQTAAQMALPSRETADAALSAVSRYYTLRQGDILLLPVPATDGFPVAIDDHVDLLLGGEAMLSFNVK